MKNYLISQLKANNIDFTEDKVNKLIQFHDMLMQKNQVLNLTRITDDKEAVDKHYIDSLSIIPYLLPNTTDLNLADIGTGAGFPGIPLAIFCKFKKICLVDSLKKRIEFLQEVKTKLDLKNICLVHARAEDLAHDTFYRESFDIVTARAVASLPILLEYLIPLLKVNGQCLCLKAECQEELSQSANALKILGSSIASVENIKLQNTDYLRTLIIINKNKHTSNKYPRKAGTPKKFPL